MHDLNLDELLPYLFLLLGIVIILLAIFKKNATATLKLTGEKVEGIIFDLGRMSNSGMGSSDVQNKVTVRFVTKAQKWITADIDQELATFYSGQYKAGDAIDVYYDKENPSKFYVDTKQSEGRARLLFIFVGAVFVVVGFYQLFITRK